MSYERKDILYTIKDNIHANPEDGQSDTYELNPKCHVGCEYLNCIGTDPLRGDVYVCRDINNYGTNVVPGSSLCLPKATIATDDLPFPIYEPLPNDNVNHPSHYTQGSIECIEAIQASMTQEAFAGYCKGNCMKYIWRSGLKDDAIQDLEKAQVYLKWLIETIKDGRIEL